MGLPNVFERRTHYKGTEDNAQIIFQTIDNLHNPMIDRICFTVHPEDNEHCDSTGLKCWVLTAKKKSSTHTALGGKAVMAWLPSKSRGVC